MDKIENEQERIAMNNQASTRESCIPHFDALWYCYTPGYQLRQYYRYSRISDCSEFWSPFLDCMKKRTAYAHQVKEKETSEHPLWRLRSKEEAQQFWEEEFGHLRSKDSASSAGQQKQERAQEKRPRSFVASGDTHCPAVAAAAAAMSGAAPVPDQARLRPSVTTPD
ncbi:g10540 [Coccomyxa viridis]|uniref:G10540 protein n=1 Tax=Coccomyxa viridis TaxID=1274662 RepID=A0ABP1G5J8_9CHLO